MRCIHRKKEKQVENIYEVAANSPLKWVTANWLLQGTITVSETRLDWKYKNHWTVYVCQQKIFWKEIYKGQKLPTKQVFNCVEIKLPWKKDVY